MMVDGEWYPQPVVTKEPMGLPESRAACPACGSPHGHGSVGATLNCMSETIYSLKRQLPTPQGQERLAQRAYEAYSAALFGRVTGPVKMDVNTGSPRGQAHGVPWEKLPDAVKRQWRAVITALHS
jgi:hypothetical protein